MRLLIIVCAVLTLSACAHPVSQTRELVVWPNGTANQVVAFTHSEEKPLTGSSLTVGEQNNVRLEHQAGQLHIRWQQAGWAGVGFQAEPAVDLRSWRQGYLQLAMSVEADAGTGIEIGLLGEQGVERRVSVDRQLQALAGKGPQTVNMPLSCLLRELDNASGIATPLRLALGGNGEITLGQVAFVAEPLAGGLMLNCPDPDTVAITPAMLDAQWARSWWLPRHQQKRQEAANGDPQIVFLGDSITQGWENEGAEVFDHYFGRWRTLNLGFGGDRTENVLWRLQHGAVDDIAPELVVLMIGTNNTGHRQDKPARVAEGVDKIVQELRSRLPETKILLLAIFPRSAEAGDLPRRNNTLINARLRNFADGEKVFFHNLNSIFLDKHGNLSEQLMPDLLHPNAEGYRLLARELAPLVDRLIETP
ncbi:MAG TPA: GDSL-type esterase/lipase family protein [Cellvibrionaceae bacterium]